MAIKDPHPDRHHLAHGFYGGFRPGTPDPNALRGGDAHRMGLIRIPATRPSSMDLTGILPPDDDQGNLGSCGPFALGHVRASESIKVGHADPVFAPLWAYWNYRLRFEGPAYVNQDTGVTNSDLVKILAGRGYGRVAECGPYDPTKFADTPPAASFGPAKWYQNVTPVLLPTLNDMLDWLASGHTFLLGFTVYHNIWSDTNMTTGLIPMPSGPVDGGHDNCACGYATDPAVEGGGYIVMRNQWHNPDGTPWTPNDLLRIPWAYCDGFNVSDCWGVHLSSARAEEA